MRKTFPATVLFVLACEANLAQTPPTILDIEVANAVVYVNNVSEYSKLSSNPGRVPINLSTSFQDFSVAVAVGDIVSVNGKPAKGTWTSRWNIFPFLGPLPLNRRYGMADQLFEIFQDDGRIVGAITTNGFLHRAGPALTLATSEFLTTIVGGTGPFLGVTGQGNWMDSGLRFASMAEDPLNRLNNGGGRARFLLQVIPLYRPEIVSTANGPSVFHDDFSLVTAAKPARAGETLILTATNLGQTRLGVDPGKPFPAAPLQEVNSPVEVTVNGQASQPINAVGWPGRENVYRVDFRLPDGTAPGLAALRLAAAWIAGPEVRIAVQ